MTKERIEEILAETGIPFAYHHFTEENAVDPPFIVYLNDESSNFYADGVVYAVISSINIELYTDEKDHKLEEKIENIFKEYNVAWEKEEIYIESEQMYEILYQMEV
jgi:hypothetical protein